MNNLNNSDATLNQANNLSLADITRETIASEQSLCDNPALDNDNDEYIQYCQNEIDKAHKEWLAKGFTIADEDDLPF